MFASSNVSFLSKFCASLPNLVSTRTIARIPIWENHIRFDPKFARKRPSNDVLDRFKRLNNGMWIRTVAARNKKRYMKNEMFNETCDDYLTCSQEQCNMLDRMMTPFWLRKKYYADDPYEPYNIRHGMDSPRVNDKKELVRERRKVLMDDTTADKFFCDR